MNPTVVDRISDIIGNITVDNDVELVYTFFEGYEKLTLKHKNRKGSLDFAGAYHPEGSCEGAGICKYCGSCM